MQKAPIPENEAERLISLHKLGLLDTSPEERFDVITRTATKIFHVPISTLTLVDAKREWFKSCQGLPDHEGDRAISFCGHALLSDTIFVVPDTKKDTRFSDNPMVTGTPHIRFYAGVPVMSADGQRVGVFCIKDTKPREFSKHDEEVLKGLASWAEVEIISRNLSLAIREERKIQAELRVKTAKLEKLDKSQEDAKKALLNVMEDLDSMRAMLELEKVKDEAILASIGDGIVGVDKDGKIIIINRAGCNLLGFKEEELLGKSFIDVVEMENENGEVVLKDKRPINMVLSIDKPTTTTTTTSEPFYQYIRRDGTKFPVAITVRPIISGKTIGAIEVFRDISHELEIDKAKSEFVSLASHQLRTPLGIMKWYLEALGNENYFKNAPRVIHDYYGEIYKSNERVLRLVRDLLSVSRIDQDRVKNTPKSFDLLQEVTEIVKQMQLVASKKRITLSLTIQDKKVPSVNIDNLRFHEVVENLIVNAVEYTLPSGLVTVTIDRVGEALSISVKDTGIGLSQVDQKKLFTKFFRSEKAVTRNPEGSGLGLYVVKSYVEGWGGKIEVDSSEGKGSIFTITLPLS